ncbi:MAG: diacylglycerol kinase family lipid kinase, partial [Armatimonadota bacterium]
GFRGTRWAAPSPVLARKARAVEGTATTCLLVANPYAGGVRRASDLARVERRLRSAGVEVRRVPAPRPSDVADALREALRGESPERTRVIVAGGDGTINAALPALMGTEFPLAVVPVGTLNVLARQLGVPLSLDAAADAAIGGGVRRIDLGIANGRPFSLMAGMGFDAAIVQQVVPALNKKSPVGLCAYLTRCLRLLREYSPSWFRVTTERLSFETRAWLVVVANASRYAYSWHLAPGASMDDGWLDLWLFQSSSPAQTAGQLLAILRSRPEGYPGVYHTRARSLRVECDPPLLLQVDGDAAGCTPADISVLPKALACVAPARSERVCRRRTRRTPPWIKGIVPGHVGSG